MAKIDQETWLAIGEEELNHIEAARQDPRAFAPLYEAYADLVWRYAMSRLGNADRARDVTSVTFARAIKALPAFRTDRRGAFRSWLMTIARNAVIDDVRREGSELSLDDSRLQAWLVDRRPSPEELAIAGDEQRQIIRALAQLPPTQRRIVELRLIGMKAVEIADILEMTISAVNTAHFRAYARLRDLLEDLDNHQGSSR